MELSKVQIKRAIIATVCILLLICLDQTSKVLVKTNMRLYECIDVLPWFKIYFTENPGMAFGIELFDTYILTIFRIIVVAVLASYIVRLIKRNVKFGFILCLAFILAGALGNIIDCLCYGVIFDNSFGQVASFMPEDGGYSTWLHGRVVDMLYFPLIKSYWPDWFPLWGGQELIFFRPIFNIADSSICVSVFVMLIFYRKSLSDSFGKKL